MDTRTFQKLCIAYLACMPFGCSQPTQGAVSSPIPTKVQRVEAAPQAA